MQSRSLQIEFLGDSISAFSKFGFPQWRAGQFPGTQLSSAFTKNIFSTQSVIELAIGTNWRYRFRGAGAGNMS
jgi:hypothetical protein